MGLNSTSPEKSFRHVVANFFLPPIAKILSVQTLFFHFCNSDRILTMYDDPLYVAHLARRPTDFVQNFHEDDWWPVTANIPVSRPLWPHFVYHTIPLPPLWEESDQFISDLPEYKVVHPMLHWHRSLADDEGVIPPLSRYPEWARGLNDVELQMEATTPYYLPWPPNWPITKNESMMRFNFNSMRRAIHAGLARGMYFGFPIADLQGTQEAAEELFD